MIEYHNQNRIYLQSEPLLRTNLVAHGFTGRLGGVSTGKITGLNLGFRVQDNPESVKANYRLVAEDLQLNFHNMVLAKQTHSDHIRIVTKDDAGKGLTRQSDIEDTDGLITNLPEIPLVVFSADCVPLLFLDPKQKVIAAVHAGWRGTLKMIAGKAIQKMHQFFNCDPSNILAAIGPSIGPCCCEFDTTDASLFPSQYLSQQENNKVLVDLWAMNRDQLIEHGVPSQNIDTSRICTICHANQYYSYRTHKERTGRQGAVIMLRP
ncbi:peptidoglycan editing factor PgeF [Ructibacterium gallinarum]|uniref:Purine nucleoside phosphorylase n=1 Tax=Ructibacterium gallinarum TaxID=2779355 RepID=A0A9D5M6V7_9FIRM|nr:peptidoglycan editing factor PgeF [Ructibacterium gallinarum]MBE5040639.1 peptidoglycan editing factor PgeF [Ructibacterium gallinarum]